MKHILLFGVVGTLYLAGLPAATGAEASPGAREGPQPLRVMTMNIRYDNPGDGPDAWPHRREMVAAIFRDHAIDVAGLQEAQRHQIDELIERLPEFGWYGVGRDDGRDKGEFVPILFRKKRLEAIDQSVFWLSAEPDHPGSVGWDASLPRITTRVKLRDKVSGKVVEVFNTHFDHRGRTAREKSAKLLADRAGGIEALGVIVMGDLNTLPDSAPYQILTRAPGQVALPSTGLLHDSRALSASQPRGPDSTWNGFRAIEPGRRIDYIFVGKGIRVLSHATLDAQTNGRFPSDHLPVVVQLTLP